MPCLNASATIDNAISSVLIQSYSNFELIIVDDGSSDSSISIINKYQLIDSRIKFFKNTDSHGVSFARNLGILKSVGEFICFLDSDDYLLNDSLISRLETIEKFNAKIVFGSYLKLFPDGKVFTMNVPARVSFKDMLKKNYIGNLTGLYNSKFFGRFLQESIIHEDYLMWCQLLQLTDFAYSSGPNPIGVYRVSPNSLSGNKFKSFKWHWSVLSFLLPKKFHLVIYYQLIYFYLSIRELFISKFKRNYE
jgi:glycosyltransferase involved in cell wall biosynthesis